MNSVNYNEEFKKITNTINKDKKAKLLLHACCSPCLIGVIDKVVEHFEVTIFYYNPNLYPSEEYYIRLEEIKKIIKEYQVELVVVDYETDEFYKAVKGKESLGERSPRCESCFKLRLERTAKYAKENCYDYFTTTLTISPLKDTFLINKIMQNLEVEYDIKHLPSDFKKDNGYTTSVKRSNELNLYRQNYCGCIFSHKEMLKRVTNA